MQQVAAAAQQAVTIAQLRATNESLRRQLEQVNRRVSRQLRQLEKIDKKQKESTSDDDMWADIVQNMGRDFSKQKRKRSRCAICKKKGHGAEECPNRKPRDSDNDKSEGVCEQCCQLNHINRRGCLGNEQRFGNIILNIAPGSHACHIYIASNLGGDSIDCVAAGCPDSRPDHDCADSPAQMLHLNIYSRTQFGTGLVGVPGPDKNYRKR